MNQYDDLDGAILARIDAGNSTCGAISAGVAWDEARKILGRPTWRVIDARLQSLRKRGVIEYAKGFGWIKVMKGTPEVDLC